jgi:hypothetical protein
MNPESETRWFEGYMEQMVKSNEGLYRIDDLIGIVNKYAASSGMQERDYHYFLRIISGMMNKGKIRRGEINIGAINMMHSCDGDKLYSCKIKRN